MKRVRIGEWQADPAANELRRGAEVARLEPKAMEVLMLLAQRPGQLMSREELFSAAWPGVVVGDEALTQCIIKLRRALGDDARAASYIETISKRGYRLIAPVRDGEPARRMWRPTLPAVALILLVITVGFYLSLSLQPSEAEREAAVPTITVLPFESLGADARQAYLARGISGELGAELARLPGVRVIAAKGRAVPDARYVVSGSVQRLDEQLRLNVQVMEAGTGRQLWSERFDRPFRDLFQVQDEVLRRVAEVLPGMLAQAAREQTAKRYTRSIEAYDWFLQAQARFLIRKAEDNEAARALYKKSLAADPQFARAYAGLAMTHAIDARLRPAGDSAELARALELAEAARLIDPELPEVHWALAFVHAQSRQHEAAIASLRKAIELNRSFADAYAFLGGIYTYVGEPARSVPLLRTAMRFNPEGGYLYFLLLGRAYLFENDPEQALINLREAAARNPDDMETRLFLAAAMAATGDRGAAEWEIEQIRTLHAGFSIHEWMDTYPLTSTSHRDRLLVLLARAGLS